MNPHNHPLFVPARVDYHLVTGLPTVPTTCHLDDIQPNRPSLPADYVPIANEDSEFSEDDDKPELEPEDEAPFPSTGGKTRNGLPPSPRFLARLSRVRVASNESSDNDQNAAPNAHAHIVDNTADNTAALPVDDNDSDQDDLDSNGYVKDYDTDNDTIPYDPEFGPPRVRRKRSFLPRRPVPPPNTPELTDDDDDPLTPLPPSPDASTESDEVDDQSEVDSDASSSPVDNTRAQDEDHAQDDQSEEEHEFYHEDDYSSPGEPSDDDLEDSDYSPAERQRKPRAAPVKKVADPKAQSSASTAGSSGTEAPEESYVSEGSLVTDNTSNSEPNDPNMITPPTLNIPLAPVNGVNNKSPARAANTSSQAELQYQADAGHHNTTNARAANTSSPIGPQSGEAKRQGERLATDLNQLQVYQSPLHLHQSTNSQVRSPPLQPEQSTSITQSTVNGVTNQSPPSMPLDIPRRQESTNSSSTEGSQGHPYPPSSLSDYTPEGYLKSMMPDAEQQQVDPLTTAAAQSAVSAADAAIMRLNGTGSVHTAFYAPPSTNDTFGLPGGYDNFTHPNNRDYTNVPRAAPSYPSRQTSTSTASASTSSEEEDLCRPSWERANALERAPVAPVSRLPYDPYVPSIIQPRTPVSNPNSNNAPRSSLSNNGNGYTAEPAALPLGATAHSPRGTLNSVPVGIANNESSEDDDDDADTIGDRDSRSRSTSSEIQEAPTASKGKRKAGSAAPARAAGKTTGKVPAVPKAGDKPDGRPHKRRRSEVSDSQIDPSLQAEVDDVKMETEDEGSDGTDAEDEYVSEDSDYDGPGPSKPKAKPRRAIAGRSKATASKATTPKKAKSSRAPARPNTDGITRCDYVAPFPVSLSLSSARLELTFSHTCDATTPLRVNTICPDTRIDTLLKSERLSLRANCLKTKLLFGSLSRTGLLSSVPLVTRPSLGKSIQCFVEGVLS